MNCIILDDDNISILAIKHCIDFFLNETSPELFDENGKQQINSFQDISKKAMKELHQELSFH